jgi:GrpB-like predicted nucleotidyltransferase (UPF0157 family)
VTGLRRDTVKLVDHDEEWAPLAGQICATVRRAAGALVADAQHAGSTAVADLPAKPVVDIAVAVGKIDSIPEVVRRLTEHGFADRGDRGEEGGWLLTMDTASGLRAAHLHLVVHDGRQWRDYLRFRDLLRVDLALRRRYAELKRELARLHPEDRGAYTAGKSHFIAEVLAGRTAGAAPDATA